MRLGWFAAKINFQIDATPNSSPLKKWWEITFLLGRPIIQLLLFESDLCKNIIQKTVPGPSKSIQACGLRICPERKRLSAKEAEKRGNL